VSDPWQIQPPGAERAIHWSHVACEGQFRSRRLDLPRVRHRSPTSCLHPVTTHTHTHTHTHTLTLHPTPEQSPTTYSRTCGAVTRGHTRKDTHKANETRKANATNAWPAPLHFIHIPHTNRSTPSGRGRMGRGDAVQPCPATSHSRVQRHIHLHLQHTATRIYQALSLSHTHSHKITQA
jgi:hypothetical protein